MSEQKRILFLTGVARSGTTAMAQLLNRHPDICLGIERYKAKFLRRSEFEGADFTPERFFDFRASDTNILPGNAAKWRGIYDRMAEKFPGARVVGDKIPHLYEKFDACSQVFPEAKWIYMLRDINGVASSWNARAGNPKDKWSSKRDFRAAVETWNAANRLVRTSPPDRLQDRRLRGFLRRRPRRAQGPAGVHRGRGHPGFARHCNKACATYADVVSQKPPLILEGQEEHLAATADMDTYRDLLARAAGGGEGSKG